MGDNSCIIQKHLQDKICVTLNKYPTGVSTLLPPVQQHDLSVGLRGDIESPPPPLCPLICMQLQPVLTPSLYNKQSAGQIKIMAITVTGLHILSAAKVRAESMKVLGGSRWRVYEAGTSLFLYLFIFLPLPTALCGSIKL